MYHKWSLKANRSTLVRLVSKLCGLLLLKDGANFQLEALLGIELSYANRLETLTSTLHSLHPKHAYLEVHG